MTSETVIHLEWDGPVSLDGAKALHGPTDYGIYQIYGGHPVYGAATLLYIGIAAAQCFGVRIPQEVWWADNRDAGRLEIYIGRLAGEIVPDDNEWDRQLRLAERLLIHSHSPPVNSQKSLATLERELQNVHVFNWARHRDLMPEVSGGRWTNRYDLPNYHVFSTRELDDRGRPRAPEK
ncbi:MAG: hypothetical protein AB7I50_05740 [Vicinamibacterales bacterium]